MKSGWVILDANCYKHLEDPNSRNRILRSIRAVDCIIWPTALNALELAKNSNVRARERRLTVAAELLGSRPLLPLPDEVFRLAGEALASGSDKFPIVASDFEWLVHAPDSIIPSDIDLIGSVLSKADEALDNGYAIARPDVQKFLKARNLKGHWSSIGDFLDQQWMTRSQLEDLIEAEWSRFGLRGAPDVERVLRAEPWRLHFAAFGAGLFQRAIASQQSRKIQAWDLWQLIYLAGSDRRILVTDDQTFLSAARGVLRGRHTNALALSWHEFDSAAA